MLKIYVQDHSVFGCIVVTATSMEEAHKRMAEGEFMNYDPTSEVEEHELEGFSFENIGDR